MVERIVHVLRFQDGPLALMLRHILFVRFGGTLPRNTNERRTAAMGRAVRYTDYPTFK